MMGYGKRVLVVDDEEQVSRLLVGNWSCTTLRRWRLRMAYRL